MTWVKLDDGYADDPKIVALTPQARDLFLWGLCFCSRQLTDGVLKSGDVRGCALVHRSETRRKAIAALVAAGLWIEEGDGWRIRNFLRYQPSAAHVKEERRKNAERVRRHRERRSEDGNGDGNGVTSQDVTPTPTRPDPRGSISKDVAVAVDVEERPVLEDEEPQPRGGPLAGEVRSELDKLLPRSARESF